MSPKYLLPFIYLLSVLALVLFDDCSGFICFSSGKIVFTLASLPVILITKPILGYELFDRGLMEYIILVVLAVTFYFIIGHLIEKLFRMSNK